MPNLLLCGRDTSRPYVFLSTRQSLRGGCKVSKNYLYLQTYGLKRRPFCKFVGTEGGVRRLSLLGVLTEIDQRLYHLFVGVGDTEQQVLVLAHCDELLQEGIDRHIFGPESCAEEDHG